MSGLMQRRGLLAFTGALAGLSLWLLDEVSLRGGLPDRMHFFLMAFAIVFFGGLLAMAGPLRPARAALSALPLAAGVAGLMLLASLRYDMVAEFHFADLSFAAAFALCFLCLLYTSDAADE